MKVVCIEIPPKDIPIHLEVGQIFDVEYEKINFSQYIGYVTRGYWYVEDKLGKRIRYDSVSEYFITLDEWRDKKIDKVLNDGYNKSNS